MDGGSHFWRLAPRRLFPPPPPPPRPRFFPLAPPPPLPPPARPLGPGLLPAPADDVFRDVPAPPRPRGDEVHGEDLPLDQGGAAPARPVRPGAPLDHVVEDDVAAHLQGIRDLLGGPGALPHGLHYAFLLFGEPFHPGPSPSALGHRRPQPR